MVSASYFEEVYALPIFLVVLSFSVGGWGLFFFPLRLEFPGMNPRGDVSFWYARFVPTFALNWLVRLVIFESSFGKLFPLNSCGRALW